MAVDQHFENREKEEEVQVARVVIAAQKTLVSIVVEKATNRTNKVYSKRKISSNRRLIKIGKSQIGCQKYSIQIKRSDQLIQKKKKLKKVKVQQ